MRRLKREQIAKKKVLVIKYSNDKRYEKEHGQTDDEVCTHDGNRMKAIGVSESLMTEVFHLAVAYDTIGIDEVQFFPDSVEFAWNLSTLGRVVIAAGLDGTFEQKPFKRILEIIPIAEKVTKLTAVCMVCPLGVDAHFTIRTTDEKEEEVIGGQEKYKAVCRSCLLDHQATKRMRECVANCNAAKGKSVGFAGPLIQHHHLNVSEL